MPRHALPDSANPGSPNPAADDTAGSSPRDDLALPRRAAEPAPPSLIPSPRRAVDDVIAAFDPFDSFDAADGFGRRQAQVPAARHSALDTTAVDEIPVVDVSGVDPAGVAPAGVDPAGDTADEPLEDTAVAVPAAGEPAEEPEPARRGHRHRTPPTSRPPRSGHRMPPRPGRKRKRAMIVLMAVAVGIVALPSAGVAAVDQCRWMRAANELVLALHDGADSKQADTLRKALDRAGVGDKLPAECAAAPTGTPPAVPVVDQPDSDTADTPTHKPDPSKPAAPSSSAPKPAPVPVVPQPATGGSGTGTTAAAALGWGNPIKSDDFTSGLSGWGVYNGPGHDGKGRRTPSAATTTGGLLTITGTSNGDTAGMAWGSGQKYGRWEGRVKAAVGNTSYNALMLLWPDAENWPVGGEVDFMEMSDDARQNTDMFLHYGKSNSQLQGDVKVDATQWHNWAVEWTPDHITTFLDGKQWFTTTNKSVLPPGPMHLCIQLDYFPGGGSGTNSMQVDWVKQYALG